MPGCVAQAGGEGATARLASMISCPQDAGIHFVAVAPATEGHGQVKFLGDDFQAAVHALFAMSAQTIEKGPADQRALGARCQGPQYVLAAADAAVHPDFGATRHRLNDLR